jgi:hypothetical protein
MEPKSLLEFRLLCLSYNVMMSFDTMKRLYRLQKSLSIDRNHFKNIMREVNKVKNNSLRKAKK